MRVLFGSQAGYVRDLAPIFVLTMFLFIFSTFMGYSMGDQINDSVFEGVLSNIPDPGEATALEMFTAILTNNVIASFLFLASGIIVGIPPLVFIVFNGFFVGWISYTVVMEIGLGVVFLTLLPHGVIEIPAITLSAAMGVGLGYQLINRIRRRRGLTRYIMDSLNLFVTRIVPLLIVAAAIETALIFFYA
ncbi:stage II sporulation protein M [Candidatus Bathyarchaeota archaeon]|nr:stage II sporulation protein M [Candidatus Bathyarchaeota archaeon]